MASRRYINSFPGKGSDLQDKCSRWRGLTARCPFSYLETSRTASEHSPSRKLPDPAAARAYHAPPPRAARAGAAVRAQPPLICCGTFRLAQGAAAKADRVPGGARVCLYQRSGGGLAGSESSARPPLLGQAAVTAVCQAPPKRRRASLARHAASGSGLTTPCGGCRSWQGPTRHQPTS